MSSKTSLWLPRHANRTLQQLTVVSEVPSTFSCRCCDVAQVSVQLFGAILLLHDDARIPDVLLGNTQHTETQRHRDRETERTQVSRTICTSDTFHDVRLKEPLTFHNGFMFFFANISYKKTNIHTCYRESSRTQQHSKWNGVGANRPQHMHMYSLIACG